MPALTLIPATTTSARAIVAGIEGEYLRWVASELAWTFAGEATATCGTASKAPGAGSLVYLIEVEQQPAGMCGLRDLGHAAEIKRLYVRPAYRGLQLGHHALRQLLAEAALRGHARVCLDTAPFMQAAHRLYEAHGFTDCAAYEGSEVPPGLRHRWRFMQRAVPWPPDASATLPGAVARRGSAAPVTHPDD